jgi:plasmid stabilization system protein ParE
MTFRVEIEPEAVAQIDELDLWWREHRPAAASQVVDELARVVATLEQSPEIGAPYRRRGIQNVRWLRLRKTPYLAYYEYKPNDELVRIVAVWSGARGRGPDLELR